MWQPPESHPRFAPAASTRYVENMTVDSIKNAIVDLPEAERRQLLDWLSDLEQDAWDRQMATDFAPGGPGDFLRTELQASILTGQSASIANAEPLRCAKVTSDRLIRRA